MGSIPEEEEANFVKKRLVGNGMFKAKLPFKCFGYKRVGHYVTKCPCK